MIYEIYILHCIQQRTNVFKLKKKKKLLFKCRMVDKKKKTVERLEEQLTKLEVQATDKVRI